MKKEGSIRQRGNKIELRIRIEGKQYSFYGNSESEARIKLREFKKTIKENKELLNYSNEKLGSYIEYWLKNYKYGKIKDSSYDILERVFTNQIKTHKIAETKIKDVSIEEAQKFIDDISAKYSISIVKKTIEIMKPVFRRAVVENKIRYNPFDFTVLPRKGDVINIDTPEKEFIYNDEEVQMITNCCMGNYGLNWRDTRRYRYAPAYVLLLNTGMRIGELLALTWDDVDLDKKIIKISKTLSYVKNRGRFENKPQSVAIVTTTKTQKSNRTIPINDSAVLILKELKLRQKDLGIKTKFIVSNPKGEMMNERVMEQTFKRICEENKIKYKGLHALRHTFGSVLLLKGADIKIVSDVLGHSTVNFTYDRYIHILNEKKAQTISLMQVSDVSYFERSVVPQ